MRILNKNILVTKITKEKTESGIILADSQKNEQLGKVVQIGNKVKFAKIGDTVKYYEHAGRELIFEGEEYLLLHEINDVSVIV